MKQEYDIGVGRCLSIASGVVVAKLDSVIVKKLAPDEPWQRSGTSLLHFDRKLCSERRPPEIDQEAYLDSAALARHPAAMLDLLGDGNLRKVDLEAIVKDLSPLPAPKPVTKQGSSRKVVVHGAATANPRRAAKPTRAASAR